MTKHVETLLVTRLDEGSIPSTSTCRTFVRLFLSSGQNRTSRLARQPITPNASYHILFELLHTLILSKSQLKSLLILKFFGNFAVDIMQVLYSMALENTSKLNRLLSENIPGGLFFSGWLVKNGYSAQLTKSYRDSGWLDMLVHGVMYRHGEKLSALAAVSSYNRQFGESVRIAAHSALELQGFSHYVPMGKSNLMVTGAKSGSLVWMNSDKFDLNMVYFKTSVFQLPMTIEMKARGLYVSVSSPELAFMECLHLVPKYYNYMDLYYIMEQLTALDPERVQRTLENTSSQKIKRMFLYMASKAGHYWVEMLDLKKIGLTTSKLQLVKDGVYNSTYRITVPKELERYE